MMYMGHRSVEEIRMRCKIILNQPNIVLLVEKSSSPTSAYDMVADVVGDEKTAKAARWLAILRRDYPQDYEEITKETLCHVNMDTAMKGEKNEKVVCDRSD